MSLEILLEASLEVSLDTSEEVTEETSLEMSEETKEDVFSLELGLLSGAELMGELVSEEVSLVTVLPVTVSELSPLMTELMWDDTVSEEGWEESASDETGTPKRKEQEERSRVAAVTADTAAR